MARATVRGKEHTRLDKNNQDALGVEVDESALIAVVCDGCGSSPESEVGAQIGRRLFVDACRSELLRADLDEGAWERIRLRILAGLALVAETLGCGAQAVHECLLFTLVGAVVTPQTTSVVAAGDGVVLLNGERLRLGPFADNAPPYVAYDLLGAGIEPVRFDALKRMRTAELDSLVLATDGFEEFLAQGQPFWLEERNFGNPDALRRRLSLLARQPAVGTDDTSVIVIRRKAGERS